MTTLLLIEAGLVSLAFLLTLGLFRSKPGPSLAIQASSAQQGLWPQLRSLLTNKSYLLLWGAFTFGTTA